MKKEKCIYCNKELIGNQKLRGYCTACANKRDLVRELVGICNLIKRACKKNGR